MEVERLRQLRPQFISPTNTEWTYAVNLRTVVRHEFAVHGHLTLEIYNAILNWKLRKQRNRRESLRQANTDQLIKELTGTFWRVRHSDPERQLEIKLKILMAIPGTGIGVASAILTLSDPQNFCVIDYRNWNVLYQEDKREFTVTDYKRYLADVRQLASQMGCDVQEVDYLLWKHFEHPDEQ